MQDLTKLDSTMISFGDEKPLSEYKVDVHCWGHTMKNVWL